MTEDLKELKKDLFNIKKGLELVKNDLKGIRTELEGIEAKNSGKEAVTFRSKVKLPQIYIPKVRISTPKFNLIGKKRGK